MDRRRFLAIAAAAAAVAPAARAHHGWSSFDQSRPIWLEGKVVATHWRNPHAELEIELPEKPALPADLASRPVPPQSANVDGKDLLSRATLPRRSDRRWTIELAPLSRMRAWGIEEIKPGTTVGVLGFTLADGSKPVLRAEYLFVGGQAYGLRSSPA